MATGNSITSAFGVEHTYISKANSKNSADAVAAGLRALGKDPSKYRNTNEARRALRVFTRAKQQKAAGYDPSKMTNYQSKAAQAMRPVDDAIVRATSTVRDAAKDVGDNASKTVTNTVKEVGETATKTADNVGASATKTVNEAGKKSAKRVAGRAALMGAGYTTGVGATAGASRLAYKKIEGRVLPDQKKKPKAITQ